VFDADLCVRVCVCIASVVLAAPSAVPASSAGSSRAHSRAGSIDAGMGAPGGAGLLSNLNAVVSQPQAQPSAPSLPPLPEAALVSVHHFDASQTPQSVSSLGQSQPSQGYPPQVAGGYGGVYSYNTAASPGAAHMQQQHQQMQQLPQQYQHQQQQQQQQMLGYAMYPPSSGPFMNLSAAQMPMQLPAGGAGAAPQGVLMELNFNYAKIANTVGEVSQKLDSLGGRLSVCGA